MRYSQAEKMEIIRIVEGSDLPVRRTLEELDVPRSTFYRWYERYQAAGYEGLADHKPGPRQFWNRIPEGVRQQVVEVALERPDQSPRQLAWYLTDNEGYFISETSVYRILKSFDLITSPAFEVVRAGDKFENPTKRVNEMWQTDFTQCMSSNFMGHKQSKNKRDSLKVKKPASRFADGRYVAVVRCVV
jgi:putative transposase